MIWYPTTEESIEYLEERLDSEMNLRAESRPPVAAVPIMGAVEPVYTHHARRRAAQRGLSCADVNYILQYGKIIDTRDAEIYHLRAVDIPRQDYSAQARLVGSVVITAKDGPSIITLWRNRKGGGRNLRRKAARAAALY